jgi:hypothetical protein
MKRFVLSAAIGLWASLDLGTLGSGTNQWTSLGPYGGGASALVLDPHNPANLYAVTSGGIFKSTDAGANWSATGPVPTQGITTLAIAPQTPGTLYACSHDGDGVFKTIDGGTTWNALNSGLIDKHISFGGHQYLRWVASGLLWAESRWNRLHGYREIPILVKELELAILKKIPVRHASVA